MKSDGDTSRGLGTFLNPHPNPSQGTELDTLVQLLKLDQGSPLDRLNLCTLAAKDHFITTEALQLLIDSVRRGQ